MTNSTVSHANEMHQTTRLPCSVLQRPLFTHSAVTDTRVHICINQAAVSLPQMHVPRKQRPPLTIWS